MRTSNPDPRRDGSVHCETLPNGLTVLLREVHHSPVASFQIWARVGSADERPGEEGLAHFHEHMLFKGTERRGVGEVAGEVEGAGGRINAFTSFDITVYHATLPSDVLDTGLDVLCDAVRNSRFDAEEIAREREVVLEEIRRSEDSPGHVLGDAMFSEVYHVHPYRAPILGTAESVSRFDRDRVCRFFKRWYAPDNLVVVGAGDFDAARVVAGVQAAFEDAEAMGARRERAVEPEQQGLRSVVLQRQFERVRAELAWPTTSFSHPDATYLDLLSFILGECESSRLVRRVKEREAVVDRIDSSSYTPLDAGLFSVSFESDGARAREAIEAAVREVERLRVEPVAHDELERARANFLATEHFERESVAGMANKLGSFHVLGGDWRLEERYLDAIRAARPEDLLRVARHYLDPDHLTAAVLLCEGESLDRGEVEDAVARGIEETHRVFRKPRAWRPDKGRSARGDDGRARTAASAIHSYALPGGGSLHVSPRSDVPVVAARAAFLGGLISESEQSAGLTSFMVAMWMRGTRARSALDIARSIENLAADIDGFSGRNSLGLSLEVTSDKLDPTLDLFAEILLEPAFDAEELERERRETLAAIARREDRLAQQAFLLFGETLLRHHPYRYPTIGTTASVGRFSSDGLHAHHARLVQADNLVVGVAGDVDPDRIAEAFAVRLVDLPGGQFASPAPDVEPAPREIRLASRSKERAQAHLVLGFAGLTVTDPDRHALEVIAQILAGQSGRLFLELRDRQSLAYSVNAVNVEGIAPGFFAVYIASAPDKVEDAKRNLLEQLKRLLDEAPAEEELARAKRYLSGNFAIDQQRSAARAAHIALDTLYGLGPGASLHYRDEIEAISKEDVLRVARRVIDLEAYTLAMVGDVEG